MREPLSPAQEEMDAVRVAVEFRLPFVREHVAANLALAVVGILVASLTLGSDVARSSGGRPGWLYVTLLVVPALAAFVTMAALAVCRRSQSPPSWRETRRSALLALVALPLYAGFFFWIMRRGTSPVFVCAATFFLWGLFSFVSALPDRNKRSSLGWAAATMLAGFVAPLATYESAGLLVGGWLFCGGLSTSLMMARQFRATGVHAVR